MRNTEPNIDIMYEEYMNGLIEEQEREAMSIGIECESVISTESITLGSLQAAPYALAGCNPPMTYCNIPIEKEDTMYDITTPETVAREYLDNRLRETRCIKNDGLRDKFNMNAVKAPKTLDEVKAALATIEIDKQSFDAENNMLPYFRWKDVLKLTDPTKPKDETGYKAAEKLLEKAYYNAKDAIIVKSPEDGLVAFQAFEAQTF